MPPFISNALLWPMSEPPPAYAPNAPKQKDPIAQALKNMTLNMLMPKKKKEYLPPAIVTSFRVRPLFILITPRVIILLLTLFILYFRPAS
jgi:hypothetical protein